MGRFIVAVAACGLAWPVAAAAQEENQVDEIVVEGEKSLSKLRREVWAFEEAFYARYNELNDDDELEVRCFYETPTGSRIKNHVCRAKFISDAFARNAARKRWSAKREAPQGDDPDVAEKTARFEANLQSLIESDQQLQAALARYNTARARFMDQLNGESSD